MLRNKNYTLASSHYLSKLDAINKYNLISNYKLPKIDSLRLKINPSELFNSFMSNISKDKVNILIYRSVMILYILTGYFGKIKLIKGKKNQTESSESSDDNNYVVELILKEPKEINYLLQKLSMETHFLRDNLEQEKLSKIQIQHGNICSLNTKMALSEISEINELAYVNFNDFEIEKLFLHINLVYKNIPKGAKEAHFLARKNFCFS